MCPSPGERYGTVFSLDDVQIVARNMERKTINILRKFVHQFGSIYERLYMKHTNTLNGEGDHSQKAYVLNCGFVE